MDEMAGAISEITRTSEETGKIIKTIDEIAFQTNLLALNAAVAARDMKAGRLVVCRPAFMSRILRIPVTGIPR